MPRRSNQVTRAKDVNPSRAQRVNWLTTTTSVSVVSQRGVAPSLFRLRNSYRLGAGDRRSDRSVGEGGRVPRDVVARLGRFCLVMSSTGAL